MKKLVLIILTISLLIVSAFSVACDNPFKKNNTPTPSGTNTNTSTSTEINTSHRIQYNGLFTADWKFEIEKISGWYYPTVSGTVQTDEVPDKITVICNGTEKEVEMTEIKEENDCYYITIKQQIIYGRLTEGSHDATLKGYFGDKEKEIDGTVKLVADDEYFGFSGVSFEGGASISAMDKESNWIGPYNNPNDSYVRDIVWEQEL